MRYLYAVRTETNNRDTGKGVRRFLAWAGVVAVLVSPFAWGEASDMQESTAGTAIATFGGGCFWCVEAVFELVPGVARVISGYEGGRVSDPTYRQVSRGDTGHAEVVQIHFDPEQVSYEALVDLFWEAHDPTQLNRQGADVGTQYRSVIFYHSDEQKQVAERSRQRAQDSGRFKRPIVTEIAPSTTFYPAEDYHQDYFINNPDTPYSRFVIVPKLNKMGAP